MPGFSVIVEIQNVLCKYLLVIDVVIDELLERLGGVDCLELVVLLDKRLDLLLLLQ